MSFLTLIFTHLFEEQLADLSKLSAITRKSGDKYYEFVKKTY